MIYDSNDARAHIERKYEYIKTRVDEADEFIKYAATRSSISGNKYQVTCGARQQTSAEWLYYELSRYRARPSAAAVLK